MIITAIKQNIKNKERASIYLDDEYAFALPIEVIIKNRLKVGVQLNDEQVENLKNQNDLNLCFNKAVKLISKNLKTKKQMVDYLKSKGFDDNSILAVIKKLEEYKYIDDRAYANKYLEYHKNISGKIRIKSALYSKGIPQNIIDSIVIEDEQTDETMNYLSVKYMKNKTYDSKTKIKLVRYLLSRGFEYSIIIGFLNEFWKGEEE